MKNQAIPNHTETNDFPFSFLQEKETPEIPHFKQVIPVTLHSFYISDEIEGSDKYIKLINVLKTAEDHDTIFIYLNTPGGYLNTAIQIISAIKQCSGTVVTCLEGEVCSAGTMIFLAGHKFLVNPNCSFMIHNYSGWISGKGQEIAARAKYQEEYARDLVYDVYKNFLTKEEMTMVLDGRDVWLNSKQVIERLQNRTTANKTENVVLDKLPDLIESLITEESSNTFPPKEPVKSVKRKKPAKPAAKSKKKLVK